MSGINYWGHSKASNTESFSGTDSPNQTSSTVQTGGWNSGPNINGWNPTYDTEIIQGVPAQTKVTISGTGVTRVGGPNQFKLQESLGADSVQLTGHVTDATNANTDPPLGTFVWLSRNKNVATVDGTGLVTLVGRGECDIECRYSRAANLPYTNATPSPTESMAAYATVNLTVTA